MIEQELKESFLVQLDKDKKLIRSVWDNLLKNGWNQSENGRLAQMVHRVSGAALMTGFSEIGAAAQRLETTLREMERIADFLVLESVFYEFLDAVNALKTDNAADSSAAAFGYNGSPSERQPPVGLIYIVEDDESQAGNLAVQVGRFGYAVRVFTKLSALREGLVEKLPTAILMDMVFPEENSTGAEEVMKLRKEFGDQLPVYFISVRDDVNARIQAVRAGGKGYFLKPVDINALMDDIHKITLKSELMSYRVLILDDSPVQARANALHLKKANIETQVITNEHEILDQLKNFRPDLVLLDLYLAESNGFELAQMIRQIKAYVLLPIVFLSAEADRGVQLSIVGQGGDDFLTKPVKPDQLVSVVISRIERYRQLQTLMLRDGLTGLYNHTTMWEYLVHEVNRSNRVKQPFSLAMLDIDNFKKVNDTYGHAAGDKVLRSLSLLLSRRLRNSDIIGRYGGEEFLIIFPNTEKTVAGEIMEDVRESFAQIVHISDQTEYSVTFSCGVACFPEGRTPMALSEAADKAMYQAKRMGRNRVVLT
jgi:diguanylate cyclase (GGDEF)-like protein